MAKIERIQWILMINNGQLGRYNMVLEWSEQEHEDMDRDALWDAPALQALQQSGLLKFFCTSNMQANAHLLEHSISYWDHDLHAFHIQGDILEVIVEDL